MNRIYWLLAIITGALGLGWYLFIRPYEFEVNLKVRSLPGDIIETIRLWDRTLDNASIIEVDSFSHLKQKITRGNRSYFYNWEFKVFNDTSTMVNIKITEPLNSISNKLFIPFVNQPIERDAKEIAGEFYEIMRMHLDITNVKIDGEVEMTPSFCVCSTKETDQIEKANGMMADYTILTSFINDFKLEPNGPPIVKVLNWNHSMGRLKYDFCFPIIKSDSLPDVIGLEYKVFDKRKTLKATYHGNYITSDRAWYTLIHYAKIHDYKVDGFPIEYFYDNPNLGFNEREWRAEIFLPIK